jgi:hypothetical protein
VVVGVLASAGLGVEWFVQLAWLLSANRASREGLGAAESLPRSWRSSPQALWERRREVSLGIAGVVDQREWRSDWQAWHKLVIAYRKASGVASSFRDGSSTPESGGQ